MSADLPSSRRPLLDCSGYYEDGLDDGLVPPDPFGELDQQRTTIVVNNQQDDRENELLHEDDDDAPPPHRCIEKLGLILGVIIGVIVQLSALSGSFVNVTIWGTEDGPYATATFLIWCCAMSSVFFVAFYLLRYLVEKSLQMAYSEQEKTSTAPSNATTMVEDIPSDNPLPNPTGFPSLQSNSSCRRRDSHSTTGTPAKGQAELLDDVMWHMKLHYVLGVNVGISLSWIVTNLAIGHQRISLIFALAPPALGMLWFWWMKGSNILFTTSRHDNSSFQLDTSQTLSTSFSSSLQEDYLNPLPTIPEEFDTVL